MEIGKKIRELRTARGITQETLAAELSVTPQAISKWECDMTTPDIQLLPQIAIYFGVTVDELFCLTDENELERIQNMVWDSRLLSPGELERAVRFLAAKAESGYRADRCYCLLAQLHNHQAQQHRLLAAEYAKKSLAVGPEEKDAHSELCEAMGGALPDWCGRNRYKLIEYYEEFLKKHPDYPRGYLWMLDNLIADHRLSEAKAYLEKMAKVDHSFRVPLYRGILLRAAGRFEEAERCLSEMEEQYADDWMVSLSLGDLAAERQQYDTAIAYYRRALTQQEKPRYADSYESIAQIYIIQKNYEGAIAAYEEELELFRNEWGFTEGESADKIRREITRLKAKAKQS